MKGAILLSVAAAVMVRAQVATTSEPAVSAIKAAAATTLPEASTSNVQGKAFNRFYQVWLENIVSVDSNRQLHAHCLCTVLT